MANYITFVFLGLALGAVYAALGAGITLIHRSTGVLDFSVGAVATWGAFVYSHLRTNHALILPIGTVGMRVGTWPAVVIGVVSGLLVSFVVSQVVFRPLRKAPVLAQVVASIGLLLFMQALIGLRFGQDGTTEPSPLPTSSIHVSGVSVYTSYVVIAAIAVAGIVLYGVYLRYTLTGLATRAAESNEEAAQLLDYSTTKLAGIAWVMTGVLSTFIVLLVAPDTGLDPNVFTLAVIPALAVALLGRLQSFPKVAIAGFLLGAFQSVLTKLGQNSWWPSWAQTGVDDTVPFIIIVVALFLLGGRIAARGSQGQVALPEVQTPNVRVRNYAAAVVVGAVLLTLTSSNYRFGIMTSIILILPCLSLVVVTGYLGQISLAQTALAGVAGFMLSRLTTSLSLPFPLAPLIAALIATAVGLVVSVPALRIRGAQLAVVTLAAAVVVQNFVLENPAIVPQNGSPVSGPSLFGLNLSIRSGGDVVRLQFCFLALIIVSLLTFAVARLLRGSFGRAMLAIRANERAAASAGINVAKTKILGFAIAAFLAGVGGSLTGYSYGSLSVASFSALVGVTLFATAYLGGITTVSGAVIAGTIGPLGVAYIFTTQTLHFGLYYNLIAAAGLLLNTVFNPTGIAGQMGRQVRYVERLVRSRPSVSPDAAVQARRLVDEETPVGGTVG